LAQHLTNKRIKNIHWWEHRGGLRRRNFATSEPKLEQQLFQTGRQISLSICEYLF
jgi:hypothetical protein